LINEVLVEFKFIINDKLVGIFKLLTVVVVI